GTPVIVSDLPIFAEIAGEAVREGGTQIDSPDDPEATAQAVRALSAPEMFGAASRAAYRRSQDYSWDASAQRLIEMARRAAAQYRKD
ncbi:MAG TPA: glycosyltransferase family 1 protein, partial [Candidatus Nesterenkonia stercoripullorum]|nr:glycosyltransferase family 1 protein [Candidatus Nesterenkonia stercoripullorum]